MAVVLYALGGFPSLIANLAGSAYSRAPSEYATVWLLGLPPVLAALILLGVDRESVHDVVGSPVWGVFPAGELLLRLSVLLLGPLWALALGCSMSSMVVAADGRVLSAVRLLMHGLWVMPAWHLVVVIWAATDNLTELMNDGGTPLSSLCLLAYAALVGATACTLLRAVVEAQERRFAIAGLCLLCSGLAGYALLVWGTESIIVKYERVFSALQFLLSTDRSHYVSGVQLWWRFACAHGAVVMGVCGTLPLGECLARWLSRLGKAAVRNQVEV